jgi:[NiFe] hydrogenase assembly HybE family chaperone
MTAICPDYLVEGLETVFRRIHRERMAGLPVLNPELDVEAVGFCRWGEYCLGVLVTPWFMNVMLLPGEGDAWQGISAGSVQVHHFPSGDYEFIVGEEAGIGCYQLCSLFSPMFEFSSQAAAVATAQAALDALLQPAAADTAQDTAAGVTEQTAAQQRGWEERLAEPVSRRAVLRGALFGGSRS